MDMTSAVNKESHSVQSNTQQSWTSSYITSPCLPPVVPVPTFCSFYDGYGPTSDIGTKPSYAMPLPPHYSTQSLRMPSQPWPSMMASESRFLKPDTFSPTPMTMSKSTRTAVPAIRKMSVSSMASRKILSDEDRRRMCRYHEENRNTKQSDIGALFGVERSTVSKVLSQKDKYLSVVDDAPSPSSSERPKRRFSDVERAVYNWVVKRQRRGNVLSDESTRKKALRFASTCSSADRQKVASPNWLDEFKQKHNITNIKSQKDSIDAKQKWSASPVHPQIDVPVDSPNMTSPVFPDEFSMPSLSSPTQVLRSPQEDVVHVMSSDPINEDSHPHEETWKALDAPASLSSSISSPEVLKSSSPLTPIEQWNIPSMSGSDSQQPQPPLDQDSPYFSPSPISIVPTDSGPIDPLLSQPTDQWPSTVAEPEVTFEEGIKHGLSLGDSFDNNVLDQNNKISIETWSLPPIPQPPNNFLLISSLGTPTEDDARQALELLMSYFKCQPLGLSDQDYSTVGTLLERLDVVLEIIKNYPQMLPEELELANTQ